jgi:hypothetical protein
MATPNYKGQGQPAATSSGWLGSLFAASAPAYGGAGQPTPKSSGYVSGAPAYKPAPIAAPKAAAPAAPTQASPTTATDDDTDVPTAFAIVIPRQVIEQE